MGTRRKGQPPHGSFLAHELYRLNRALQEKVRQLPTDTAGIVVLWDNHAPLESPYQLIASHLGEALREHPHTAAVALIAGGLNSTAGRATLEAAGHWFIISRPTNGIFREEVLIVKNRATQYPVPDDVLLRLFSAQ